MIEYIVRFKVRFWFPPCNDYFKKIFISNNTKIIKKISKYIIKFNNENPMKKIFAFEIIKGEL